MTAIAPAAGTVWVWCGENITLEIADVRPLPMRRCGRCRGAGVTRWLCAVDDGHTYRVRFCSYCFGRGRIPK